MDARAGDRELRDALEEEAVRLGFSLFGVAPADPSRHMEHYRSWVEAGRHGHMTYMARQDAVDRRADLTKTMTDVASVVVVAHEYFQPDPEGIPDDPALGVVARYARGDDYHLVVGKKLKALLRWLDGSVGGGVSGRAYVDTGPILERELGQRAGLGWFGRNTMLISPDRGSYFFLGLLLVDIALPSDAPFTEDRCGTCRMCLEACPTKALLGRDPSGAPVIDARRCISYLTIELRGPIPRELRHGMGNRVFGCDICQEVCPWNERFAERTEEPRYAAREALDGATLLDLGRRLLGMDDEGFRELFRRSPLRRAGRPGLLRNVCVALGNWGAEPAVPVLRAALDDPEPLVRMHAAWALGEVGSREALAALRTHRGLEADARVLSEVEAALAPR